MIDPALALALSLEANPGGYALLLGAGVSVAARVPSAWDVQHALLVRLAAASGSTPDDPFAWYRERFGERATYDGLLEALTSSPDERMNLMRSFFEPTEEEREADPDAKQPTAAHRAVAHLVAEGAVRIVLTTNFDLLTETAIRAAGVEPVICSTVSDIEGLSPLHNVRALVVHLHGDYLSPGMLNTADELGAYPKAVDDLLDSVFDNYGLAVVGWSAVSDRALREAVARVATRRFATYWCEPFALSEQAQRLVTARQASVADVDADTFLRGVADGFDAIRALTALDPRSLPVAVATAKRSLGRGEPAIALHDQLHRAFEAVRASEPLTRGDYSGGSNEAARRAPVIEADMGVAVALVATTAYWGNDDTDEWWLPELTRWGARPQENGSVDILELHRVPAVGLHYAAGVAACARPRHELLARLLTEPRGVESNTGSSHPLHHVVSPDAVLPHGRGSERLYRMLKPIFAEHLAIGAPAFRDAFERWEYILCVEIADAAASADYWIPGVIPYGRVDGYRPVLPVAAMRLADDDRPARALLASGLFGGDRSRFDTACAQVNEEVGKRARDMDYDVLGPSRSGVVPSGRHYPGSYTDSDEPRPSSS